MKKVILTSIACLFLSGCGPQSAALVGNGVALVGANDLPRLALSKSTDALIKQKTGKTTFDHIVSNNRFENKIRACEIYNSNELNKIFFETLDEIDCSNEITHFEQLKPR
tara:strand:- start:517 stop:846 length:330 start_codon:yes stop_codon:yes gene_type:complete